jgi:alkyl hydroperoxide reductase subunit AhpC
MGLHIGSTAPDFTADSTAGTLSFHEWAGKDWVIFFSHPADFTPVCTTELGTVAKLREELAARGAKAIAISVDSVADHHTWSKDIEETQGAAVNFPILADPDRRVSHLYDMIPPNAPNTMTVRSVFFIDPNKKIRAMITYPASTGRNFHEIIRVIDSLQLTDGYQVATPANWKDGEDVVVVPSVPTSEIPGKFPKGHTVIKPYLRMTPQPNR